MEKGTTNANPKIFIRNSSWVYIVEVNFVLTADSAVFAMHTCAYIYRKLPKISPFCAPLLDKSGEEHLLEYSVCLMRTPPPSILCSLECT